MSIEMKATMQLQITGIYLGTKAEVALQECMQSKEYMVLHKHYLFISSIWPLIQGGSKLPNIHGAALINDYVMVIMTSLLPFHLQNIGGAAAPPAIPFATSLL